MATPQEFQVAFLKVKPPFRTIREQGVSYHLRGDAELAEQALELLKAEDVDEKYIFLATSPAYRMGLVTRVK